LVVSPQARFLLIDGFVDEPACLGVPPYLSPQVRAAAGAARDAGAEVEYITIDHLRRGDKIPPADLTLVIAGVAVPGKYLRASPASSQEIQRLVERLPGVRVLGGPATLEPLLQDKYDLLAHRDPAMVVYSLLQGEEPQDRWRTMEQWERWLLAGAEIVAKHSDFPQPLMAEIETYRGCVRYASGGCSFCVEPLKGKPVYRDEEAIIAECKRLAEIGVRNFRLGGQSCIISYKADLGTGDPPRPNPRAVERLLSGVTALQPDVLHVDNANPAVIASYPEESAAILRTLVKYCTPGNVLALGLESADPEVQRANNLNSTAEQAMEAIRMINEVGGARGDSGLPYLLPGLNLIVGLDGETVATPERNMTFLHEVLRRGYLLRRLNIRQVIAVRKEFTPAINRRKFIRFKERVRKEIDRPMLQRLVPAGTVLRRVYTEARDGNTTFGRQIGSYPLLVGFPYPIELDQFVDAMVMSWGYRSVTAIEYPLKVNSCPLAALQALPKIGRKRAIRLFHGRPLRTYEDLVASLDDPAIAEELRGLISFD